MADGTIEPEEHTEEERRFYEGWQPLARPHLKDEAASRRLRSRIKAKPKLCWFNARKAIQKLDEYADASYVEGHIVLKDGFGPIEHGWIVRDGVIIDPTLPDSVGAYYPGLEFAGRSGIEEFLATPQGKACKRSPFFFAFGWGGMLSPGYRRAYEESMEFVRGLYPESSVLSDSP
ncbi:hypothetical protein [Tautonia plasticadhaerens]|uniref:hypothetical protein n=1 Tax=Tautonia plasticadhaerens TaxID=2527974 RepID=UPI00119DCF6D|nr:hypothetical protein [Tautonia plasticadhaerens]